MNWAKRLVLAAGVSAFAPDLAEATTATSTMAISLTIAAACTVVGGTAAFGSAGVLATAIPTTGALTVTCTNTTPYTVGLDQGANGASVTTRKMKSPTTAAFVSYSLTQDVGHATNWGNTAGSWVSGTGNGAAQPITVYAVVPSQTTPAPAADYADTVTITVTY
jgi:spore coat protein U-like protein